MRAFKSLQQRRKEGGEGGLSPPIAKEYQQQEKKDYNEVYAPVVKGTTLRTLFAAAAIKGWMVKQMDIVTAFLNGVLEEETYMEQPEGYNDGKPEDMTSVGGFICCVGGGPTA
ncbi:hypothetical protein CLOM_g9836 [Closterium sp. NIES-68]|nr:hypothetical protein CLOM_g9836 [Closterium sp. NIES-68]